MLKDAVSRFKLKNMSQINKTNNFDNMNTQIAGFLEDGQQEKDMMGSKTAKNPKAKASGKKKNNLDDQEFGKY